MMRSFNSKSIFNNHFFEKVILIADSGASKTDWCLIDTKNNKNYFKTSGFSPHFQNASTISDRIKSSLIPQIKEKINDYSKKDNKLQIHFYGAGCSSEDRCYIVYTALKQNFPKNKIEVHHDILGAARALCGTSEGIVAIMGTGSNSCYYDGKNIVEETKTLGYVFGDEGSGAHLGKTFIQAYLNKKIPKTLSNKFDAQYRLTIDEILDTVYSKPLPNKFLSSFSPFLHQNIHEQFVHDLVTRCFNAFFDKHICMYAKWQEITFNCVGSVGYYFSILLKHIALSRGMKWGRVLKAPMDELIKYHASTIL